MSTPPPSAQPSMPFLREQLAARGPSRAFHSFHSSSLAPAPPCPEPRGPLPTPWATRRLSQPLAYPLPVFPPSFSSCSHFLMKEAVKSLWLGHWGLHNFSSQTTAPGAHRSTPGPPPPLTPIWGHTAPGGGGLSERKPHRRGCAGCRHRPEAKPTAGVGATAAGPRPRPAPGQADTWAFCSTIIKNFKTDSRV